MPVFIYRRHGIKICAVIVSATRTLVDREITDSERSKVLEEMRALARLDTVIAHSSLHYHLGARNIGTSQECPRLHQTSPSGRVDPIKI